jgi:hypothetical protein
VTASQTSVFFTVEIGNSNRETVFSMRSLPCCYKQDSWSNELVMEQSPAGKNVSREAEDIVGIRHQAMTSEDKTD